MTHTAPRRRSVIGGIGSLGLGALTPPGTASAAGPTGPADSGGERAPSPVTYKDKRILIDGRPAVVLSGEIHYFRLDRKDWQSRLDRAKAAGLDTIATYIPWMWHELPGGSLDVTGRTRPERDLGAFLDLCHENGFRVIARPGPFTMAELKGEGVPARVREEHPEIVPTGWNDEPGTTRTVDYLAPAFLKEARRWYAAVMPVIAERLHRPGKGGGGVIAVQLDNEIGMLAWVSNSPSLTDHLTADFDGWLREEYGDELPGRYPFADRPLPERRAAIRSPEDSYAAALMHDLGRFTRGRFARYVTALRDAATGHGIEGVPFVINIHGTSDQRAEPFPIGISQLMETYAGVPGTISGSDVYLGDLTLRNVTDLYLVNAFMDAVHDADQPLTSLEFEAGSGDYGQNLDTQFDPSAAELKTRLCLAQGVKLINYYLFAGGHNPELDKPVGDGNDRIGITGERHGFAAPVDPEGRPGIAYEPTRRAVAAARSLAASVLPSALPEYDELALGFVPDHYLTEYRPPGSDTARAVVDDLVGTRGAGPRGSLARAMLLSGFRYRAVNLQRAAVLTPEKVPALALATGEHLAADLQRRLVRYVESGGRLLLSGRLPTRDMAGGRCTVLADALGLSPGKILKSSGEFFLSATAHGWAAPRPEVRVDRAQLCRTSAGAGRGTTTVLREVSTGQGCGFDVRAGSGRAVVITTDYQCDLVFWRRAFTALGASPALEHSATVPGVFLLTTAGQARGADRLLHAFNVSSGFAADFTVTERGKPLFGGERLHLPGRGAAMLPLGLTAGGLRIAYATAEITEVSDGRVAFRAPGGGPAVVAVEGRARCEGATGTTTEAGRTVFRVRDRREFTVRSA